MYFNKIQLKKKHEGSTSEIIFPITDSNFLLQTSTELSPPRGSFKSIKVKMSQLIILEWSQAFQQQGVIISFSIWHAGNWVKDQRFLHVTPCVVNGSEGQNCHCCRPI